MCREELFYNADVNTNVVGLITDCTGDFDAIAGVHGSAAMCGEELFYNADVNTNVVGLITDCTGGFGTTAGVPDSAATGGVCNLVSSSGNLQEKETLPMDKETFTENVPSDAKGGCELEGEHEQSMLSVCQGYYLCRDDTDPCGFAEKCQTPSPPVPVPTPTPSPSNVISEGDLHVSSRTDDHRPEGDAPHKDGPETGSDPGVIRWCTRPSTGLSRTARAFNKVARLRQAAKKWDGRGARCTPSD